MKTKYQDVLHKAKFSRKRIMSRQKRLCRWWFYFPFFLALKLKYCSTIDKFGIFREHKTFEGFNDSKRLLDRSPYFKMIEGKKLSALLPKSWKKSFDSGIIILTKMSFCAECDD